MGTTKAAPIEKAPAKASSTFCFFNCQPPSTENTHGIGISIGIHRRRDRDRCHYQHSSTSALATNIGLPPGSARVAAALVVRLTDDTSNTPQGTNESKENNPLGCFAHKNIKCGTTYNIRLYRNRGFVKNAPSQFPLVCSALCARSLPPCSLLKAHHARRNSTEYDILYFDLYSVWPLFY